MRSSLRPARKTTLMMTERSWRAREQAERSGKWRAMRLARG